VHGFRRLRLDLGPMARMPVISSNGSVDCGSGARYGWKLYASRKGSEALGSYRGAGLWSGRSHG
jgi:hypothetical protein